MTVEPRLESWELVKEFRFEASHQLPYHDGKCARLHGHSWVARVCVVGTQLVGVGPKAGMLVDFASLKTIVAPLVDEYLDHHHLNETLAPFGIENPTSEEVARWLFDQVAHHFDAAVEVASRIVAAAARGLEVGYVPPTVRLEYVRIDETCTSACTYSRGRR